MRRRAPTGRELATAPALLLAVSLGACVTPAARDAPPPKDPAPPGDAKPAAKDATPAPKPGTPPPKDGTSAAKPPSAPKEGTPPPKEGTPPPKEGTPPPKESPPAAKDGTAAPKPPAPATQGKPGAEAAPAAKPSDAKTPDAKTPDAKTPPPAAPAAPAPADDRSALRSAVEDVLGTPVHGRFSVRYQLRSTDGGDDFDDETDQDVYSYLDLRVGDERRDRLSANFHVRTAWDVDDRPDDGEGSAFSSLADTYDHEFTALLDTAYVTWRPSGDALETVVLGRQYEYVAETFHFDGVSVLTKPAAGDSRVTVRAYAGIPIHFYEASSHGDVVAGVQVAAEPWKGGRAAVDYAHVEDEFSGFGDERDDLAAAQVWHAFGTDGDLHGRFTWLDGPSDVSLRGTLNLPGPDLLVQGSIYRLLEAKEQLSTELDPYVATLHDLEKYWLGELRATLGLGEKWRIETGGYVRELDDDVQESDYNRNTRRFWITPSVDDLVADRSTLSAGLELWTGDGERIETWIAEYEQRFTKDVRGSIGTDWSLYAYGPLQDGERTHVRTVYVRGAVRLTEALSLDLRYAWERDDEETWHVLSLALGVDF